MADQRPNTVVHNSETGQVEEREMTLEEFELYQDTVDDAQVIITADKIQEQQKEAAVAKLIALGLTEADLRALGI
jgi:hypothetical protein